MCKETTELHPVYDTPEPNQDIQLSNEKVNIIFNQDKLELEASVVLRFLPSPHVRIYGELSGRDAVFKDSDYYKLSFPMRNFSIEVLVDESEEVISETERRLSLTMEPRIEPFAAIGIATDQIKKVVFHLLNFCPFYAKPVLVESPTQSIRLDQVELKAEGWKITLASMRTTKAKRKRLRAEGGYAITHIGQIEREDGRTFTKQQAEDLIQSLYYFLSFARGFWVAPILPVGFDESNNRVWEEWGCKAVDEWQSVLSWFDGSNGNLLVQLYPEFLKMWQAEDWGKPIKDILVWYVRSNTSTKPIEAGVILTQAALELLAWNYAVKDKKLISEKGFNDRLSASDQFQLLLSSLNIPIEIPSHLKELNKLAKGNNWVDAPQTLAKIRNNIIHPKKKIKFQSSRAIYECWNLGLWYTELVLLRLFGHCGQYTNRLVQKNYFGKTEMVPWVNCDE